MCGRYTLYSSPDELANHFSATLQYRFGKSYNIAPTSTIAVLIAVNNERLIVPMRWGLIPAWHKEGQKMMLLNNAKLETIDSKPSFRTPFKRQRCLILANGFYEWDATTTPKQPHYFHRADQQPIALAGIWDKWMTEHHSIDSCCIITAAANEIVAPVHERMPGIITPDQYDSWLDMNLQDTAAIKKIAANVAAYDGMESYRVTTKMNRAAYDSAQCIKQI